MRQALSRSYNIPAVDALSRAGIGNVLRNAHKLGINDLDKGLQYYGLALTLGGGEVKLLDMAYVYSVFANGGSMIGSPRPASMKRPGYRDLDPVSILRVEDVKGNILYDYKPATNPNLLGPTSHQLTYLLTSVLSDPIHGRPPSAIRACLISPTAGSPPSKPARPTTTKTTGRWATRWITSWAYGWAHRQSPHEPHGDGSYGRCAHLA